MSDPVTISCVMALHNGAAYVADAIQSLVHQSLRPVEIIVVDDGSTDDGAAIAEAAGEGLVTIVRQRQAGMDAARNAGRTRATGSFVHFFDQDDLAPADALACLSGEMLRHPECDAVFGKRVDFWIAELAHEQPTDDETARIKSGIWVTAGLFRHEFLAQHPFHESLPGQFNPSRWLIERQTAGAGFRHVDALTLRRRIHHDNMSRRKSAADMLAMVLDLRRRTRSD